MIEINMTGICEECRNADIDIYYYQGNDGELVLMAKCKNEKICYDLYDRIMKDIAEEELER